MQYSGESDEHFRVISNGMDNNEVERHLNAQAPSFLSHVRVVVAKREHVEREGRSVGALKDEVHVEDGVSCRRRVLECSLLQRH